MINDGKTVPLSQGREPSQTTQNQSKSKQHSLKQSLQMPNVFCTKKEAMQKYLVVNDEFSSAESV